MQLSSALLSAAAILTQVASGFYISTGEGEEDLATYQEERIGFYNPPGDEPASFELNGAGELVSEDDLNIAFFDRGDGVWRLEVAPSSDGSDGRRSIGGSFAIEGGRLVYQGEELQWWVCGTEDALDLCLASPTFDYDPNKEQCHEGTAISVDF